MMSGHIVGWNTDEPLPEITTASNDESAHSSHSKANGHGCGKCRMTTLAWIAIVNCLVMFTCCLCCLIAGILMLDYGAEVSDGPWAKAAPIWSSLLGLVGSLVGISSVLEVIGLKHREKLFESHFIFSAVGFATMAVSWMFIWPAYTDCKDSPNGGYCQDITDEMHKDGMVNYGLVAVVVTILGMLTNVANFVYYGLTKSGELELSQDLQDEKIK